MKFSYPVILLCLLPAACSNPKEQVFSIRYDDQISFRIAGSTQLIYYNIVTDYPRDTSIYFHIKSANDTFQAVFSVLRDLSYIKDGDFESNAILAFDTQDKGKCRKEDTVKAISEDLNLSEDLKLSRVYSDYYIEHRYVKDLLFSKMFYCKNYNCSERMNELIKIKFRDKEW